MATPISTITPEQLHAAQLRGDRPALLDVRTAAEYLAGHIPGAQLLPVGELRSDEVTRRFIHAAPEHQETLYITCRSGARAQQAAERLQLAGFTNLALVEGGTQGWEQAGLIVAGVTRWCGMAQLIARMPWNRGEHCPERMNA